MTRDELKVAFGARFDGVVQKIERALIARGEMSMIETWHSNAESNASALAMEKAMTSASVAEIELVAARNELVDFVCDHFPAARTRKSKR